MNRCLPFPLPERCIYTHIISVLPQNRITNISAFWYYIGTYDICTWCTCLSETVDGFRIAPTMGFRFYSVLFFLFTVTRRSPGTAYTYTSVLWWVYTREYVVDCTHTISSARLVDTRADFFPHTHLNRELGLVTVDVCFRRRNIIMLASRQKKRKQQQIIML